MDSIIIVAQRSVSLEQVRNTVPSSCLVEDAGCGRFVVVAGDSRVYVGTDLQIEDELEPDERSQIVRVIPEPTFFVLEFSDIQLCKEVLSGIADRPDVLVDNGHGVICSGSEFVSRLRKQPDWDWRLETP